MVWQNFSAKLLRLYILTDGIEMAYGLMMVMALSLLFKSAASFAIVTLYKGQSEH
jgi:hypothetical protein